MARTKIDYGLDLGTTNSAIARMENGNPTIKKTDTGAETMPSCVFVNRNKVILVGDTAFNNRRSDKLTAMRKKDAELSNSFIEFKRTMGTDKKYRSKSLDRDFSSEELSSEVLKTIKSFVNDDEVRSIVITVPAKFEINKRDATSRAAQLAGFDHCELLQEPIAASMAYGIDAKSKDGFWLVFDFGGGTFDAALLKVEEGIMKIIDTDGDMWLGGRNLDYAVVDEILIPWLQKKYNLSSFLQDETLKVGLQEAIKYYAEEAKIQLSFKDSVNILSGLGELGDDDAGEEIDLDITISTEDLIPVVKPFFQKAIDKCLHLLDRNNLSGSSIDSLILVGGPTKSPILQEMLEEQITKPDTSCDPMTAVAKGAALFASTIDIPEEIQEKTRDKTKIQIGLGYEPATVEEETFVTVKILTDKTEGKIPDKVFADISRTGQGIQWSSGKVEIDATGEIIEVKLERGRANLFQLNIYNETGDLLESEPKEFTILQGTKPPTETLSHHIGIAIKTKSRKDYLVFNKILEKNASTPVTGVTKKPLKTQIDLRPGIKDDFIKIPIYQGEYDADGTRAAYNYHVTDVIITGNDVNGFLPAGSDIEITLKVDRSNSISFSAFFPALNYSHKIDHIEINSVGVTSDFLETEMRKAMQSIKMIKEEGVYSDIDELDKIAFEIEEISKRLDQGKGDYDRREQVFDNLRGVLRRIDNITEAAEWPKTEEELKDVFYRLEETNSEFGNEKTATLVEQFKEQIPKVIKEKNVKVARELIDAIRHLDFVLMDQGLGAQMEIGLLHQFNEDFDSHDWSDRNKARTLINQGLQMAVNNPSKQQLRPIVIELYRLLPSTNSPIAGDDTVLTD